MMLAARGAIRASGAGLPYDAEVEYLQSSGTQYIDTGIKPGPNTRVEAVFAMTTFTANCGLFGARGNAAADDNSYNLFIISNSGARVRWDWSGSGQYQTSEADTSTDATYVLGAAGGTITRNGSTVMSVSASKAAINYPLYVFNFNNVGTPYSTGANARFWSVKIYEGQTLVFDLIPVRKGTVGYLYDRVSGKLFGNAGTGDFVLGPDVVPVEYIESHGTEYINTGIVATNAHGVRIDIATAQKSGNTNTRIFGTHEGNTRFGFALFGTGESTGNDAFFGWNAATSFVATIPQRFVASLNYQNDRKAIFNGTTYISSLGTLGSMTLPFYLLNANYNGAPFSGQYVIGKLYGAEVSVGSSITNRYKPVRVGTEGAMMDTLTRKIYRNAGTGAFSYGNDLKYPIPA